MDPATERIITYLRSCQVSINVAMFRQFDLVGGYRHAGDGPDRDEYVVPVTWIKTLDPAGAVREKGPVRRFTLDTLVQRFGLEG